MQIKLFTIPVGDSGGALSEMNAFLRGNKILEVENQLVNNEHGAYWCFCVRYIERAFPEGDTKKKAKVDYRSVLDEATFQKFSKLRQTRKQVAAEEGISAFIIFTDEELAELAKLDEITEKSMLAIKGVGEKKVERFAKYFITQTDSDEAAGISD
ncbi:MAG TPA: HRDC domain-containing protein [Saprospiraceae bacterium]|nr:HRDC domain-containing protein [Saprospiraceae bacterium]HMP25600.1 HRDC domain-containing protein [Saprospiraceae bacterium]